MDKTYTEVPITHSEVVINSFEEDGDILRFIVNGYSAANPFMYNRNGRIVVEYQCPDGIRANVGKKVPMGIYHNLDGDSVDLPDNQIVGTYEVIEYDEDAKQDVAVIEVSKNKIDAFFESRGERNWIKEDYNYNAPISTAYPTKIRYDRIKNVHIQMEMPLASVSFVKIPNCTSEYCTSDYLSVNKGMKECIKNKYIELKDGMEHTEALNKAIEECRR